ncbi:MAG: citrate lyase holo-[acyl-carrier protein] synthase, partial [Clostridia bacterium]|nr:citrate lyase holo-[acyl-carrier protein] synthase [Clostridia bacterium]
MDNDNAITLNELLISREERAKKQKCLIQTYKANLISFMVNIPGAPKNTYTSRKLHHEGRDSLKKKLKESNINILYAASYYRVTGAETFILSHADAIKLKEISIHIENNHPLGRLFDFDVINKDFTFISRTDVGYEKRKCLLCDEDA